MQSFMVVIEIRAECLDDARELINDYTGKETHVEIIYANVIGAV